MSPVLPLRAAPPTAEPVACLQPSQEFQQLGFAATAVDTAAPAMQVFSPAALYDRDSSGEFEFSKKKNATLCPNSRWKLCPCKAGVCALLQQIGSLSCIITRYCLHCLSKQCAALIL
jgi:hypothetical protein